MLLILRKRARLLYVELLKRISHLIFFFLSLLNDGCGRATSSTFLLFLGGKRRDLPCFRKKKGRLPPRHRKEKKGSNEQEVVFLQKSNITVYYSSNLRIKISSVNVGLALPPLSLKHAPTKKPFNFVFPDRYCSSWFGFISKTF